MRRAVACAKGVALRFSGPGLAYEGLARRAPNGTARWTGDVRFVREKLADPLRWKKPQRIFVNSMSDLFHPQVEFEVIAAAFGVMAVARQHTFLILTKHPERAAEFFSWNDRSTYRGPNHAQLHQLAAPLHFAQEYCEHKALRDVDGALAGGWPLSNVHLGVSVEDQETLEHRVPVLRRLPAWFRWVSYEPALGHADFTPVLPAAVMSSSTPAPLDTVHTLAQHRRLWAARRGQVGTGAVDWIVVGGESGSYARPFRVAWARDVVAACARAGVPVFVKQLGGRPVVFDDGKWGPLSLKSQKGNDPSEWPAELRVRQVPAAICNPGELVQALRAA